MQMQIDRFDLALCVRFHDAARDISPFLPRWHRDRFGGIEKNGFGKNSLSGPSHFSVLCWTDLRHHWFQVCHNLGRTAYFPPARIPLCQLHQPLIHFACRLANGLGLEFGGIDGEITVERHAVDSTSVDSTLSVSGILRRN